MSDLATPPAGTRLQPYRWVLWVLLLAILALGWTLLYGQKGWWHQRVVAEQIEQTRSQNDELHRQIVQKQQTLEILKSNDAALEELARVRLGMVAPGETLLIPLSPPPEIAAPEQPASSPAGGDKP